MLFAFLPIVAPAVLAFEGFRASLAIYDGVMAGFAPRRESLHRRYVAEGNVLRLI